MDVLGTTIIIHDDGYISASRPWSGGGGKARYERHEDQREIDTCLECPLSECTDCYRYKRFRFSYLARVERRDKRT